MCTGMCSVPSQHDGSPSACNPVTCRWLSSCCACDSHTHSTNNACVPSKPSFPGHVSGSPVCGLLHGQVLGAVVCPCVPKHSPMGLRGHPRLLPEPGWLEAADRRSRLDLLLRDRRTGVVHPSGCAMSVTGCCFVVPSVMHSLAGQKAAAG